MCEIVAWYADDSWGIMVKIGQMDPVRKINRVLDKSVHGQWSYTWTA